MKRLKELPFSELASMYQFSIDMADAFEEASKVSETKEEHNDHQTSVTKWESYSDELEVYLEERIKYALGKEDNKAPMYL
ncbi:hypothetical protein GCM10028803_45680 [Larkinella knui]|uniref:Uncharacterized protein n=1 Tax=Larkinella knui TaxID=2025310 RepID=A0A3P1CPK4_9BACT|nr:hypothetical protein [Larkinella knui]RRB15168.1 hypothetical protein EHT87_11520 [Larkinella knui]